MTTLHIRLLGESSFIYGDAPLTQLSADRLQSLLVYLLLHRHNPQSRQHLAFLLWPDSAETQARTNLRTLLHYLRRALPDADKFLTTTSLTMQWKPDAPFTLDVAEFERLVAEARQQEQTGEAAQARQALEAAIGLYRGDLLPGSYDDWIAPLREALSQTFLDALQRLILLLEAGEEYGSAIRYAQRLVQADPLQESSYVQLMRLYALNGDRAGVQRTYQSCVAILQRELEVEPSPVTTQAYQQWLRWEAPSLELPQPLAPSEVPAPADIAPVLELDLSPQARPLPQPTTPLIGREDELAELGALLAEPTQRLLSLLGPGGVGKTRLALQMALAHQQAFRDGAVWVPLASVVSTDLLAPAIADALGITFQGTGSFHDQLFHYLQERHLLIGLDNFEHLLDGAALLSDLLARAPEVKLLVTSRVRLDLQEEWVWEVGGLSLPQDLSPEALEASGAVRLFLYRAQQAYRGWAPTPEDLASVVRICELVEGMPLGIELAAAWVRMLSPREIVQEIERSLDFLVGSQRNMPERHRSLRAVFDHSWSLLTEEEQRVLRCLSVFRGGFSRDAAEQVAGATLPLLASLVDKSLVRRVSPTRYSLHEVVRQYAAFQLSEVPDEREAAEEKHGRYFLTWASQQNAAIRGPAQQAVRAALRAEVNNLRCAWEWAVNHQQTELLHQAAPAFFYFYELQAWYEEGEATFQNSAQTLAEVLPGTREAAIRGLFLTYQGWHTHRLGRLDDALALLEESLSLSRPFPEVATFASDPSLIMGYVLNVIGGDEEAHRMLQEGLDTARAGADAWSIGTALMYHGWVHAGQGRLEEAELSLQQSLAIWRQQGDPRSTIFCLNIMGTVMMEMERAADAERLLQESLTLAQEQGDVWGTAEALKLLGQSVRMQGKLPDALALFRESAELFEEMGNSLGAAQAYQSLGEAWVAQGETEAAEAAYRQALVAAQAAEAVAITLDVLLGIAASQAERGATDEAIGWLEQIEAHPDTPGVTRNRASRLRAELAATLPRRTNGFVPNGPETSLEEVIEAVLRVR